MATVVAMRVFYSPAERRILASLPVREAAIIESLHEALDARLVGEERPPVEQPSLFDVAA